MHTVGYCVSPGEWEPNLTILATPLVIQVELEPDTEAIRRRVLPELKATANKLIALLADIDCEP